MAWNVCKSMEIFFDVIIMQRKRKRGKKKMYIKIVGRLVFTLYSASIILLKIYIYIERERKICIKKKRGDV